MKKLAIVSVLMLISIWLSSVLAAEKVTRAVTHKISHTPPAESVLVWVFFTDKGPLSEEIYQVAERDLHPRTYQRRLKHAIAGEALLDFHDLPLADTYVQEVARHVLKIRQKSRWLNAVSVEVTPENIQPLAAPGFVRKVDLVFTRTDALPIEIEETPAKSLAKPGNITDNLNYGSSYDQNNQINVIPLHNLGFNGAGVLIAMLDAGFNNLQHQALRHLNILHTWDFVNGDSIVWDEPGQMGCGDHGTFTLSALAGYKEGELIGPAYGADFILAKTENTDWERHIEEDAWIAGAEWADSLGAQIISSSLGYLNTFTHGDTDYTWHDMDGNTTIVTIGADIAASRGILVVNSAGNEGGATFPANSLIAPADGDSVLAVGSVNSSGLRSSFSSMGPTVDGRIKPDVMARGSQTRCAGTNDTTAYWSVSGTSLSCPLVAGAAALVLQANPNLTNMQVIEALRQTASQAATANNEYGWGIINTLNAAQFYTELGGEDPSIISELRLHANYPNPFNPATTVTFDVPRDTDLSLQIFNILGERVGDLYRGPIKGGSHQIQWNAGGLPSGMYYIVVQIPGQQVTRKALLLR